MFFGRSVATLAQLGSPAGYTGPTFSVAHTRPTIWRSIYQTVFKSYITWFPIGALFFLGYEKGLGYIVDKAWIENNRGYMAGEIIAAKLKEEAEEEE